MVFCINRNAIGYYDFVRIQGSAQSKWRGLLGTRKNKTLPEEERKKNHQKNKQMAFQILDS